MKIFLGLILLSSCAAVPMASAEEACLSVFHGWIDAGAACGLEATSPDEVLCRRAYSYDDDELAGCVGWMKVAPCEELDNAHFQAHCGKAIYLKTW